MDLFSKFAYMPGKKKYISTNQPFKSVVPDMSGYYTCSFTEFMPFCISLYYFSNFKDFNTLAQA